MNFVRHLLERLNPKNKILNSSSTEEFEKFVTQSKHFCMAPWVHMSVWPNGNSYPCCLYDWEKPTGNVNETGYKKAWNSEKMRQLRLKMLKDQKIAECYRCMEYESVGVTSYRSKMNTQYAHHRSAVQSTQNDGHVEQLNIAYFDIRFSNLCNMKCRTCGSHFSSRWTEDTEGKARVTEITHPDLWRDIEELLPHIEEIYFTGGESLIMEQHYQLLDRLIERDFSPKLTYNSNASKISFKKWSIKDLWPHFDNIEFLVSLDQVGSKAEYTRHGQKWSTVFNNLRVIRNEMPFVKVFPSPTISLFNILDLDEIVLFLLREDLCTDGVVLLNNLLITPREFAISNLPSDLKKQVAKSLQSLLEKLQKMNLSQTTLKHYAKGVDQVIAYMNERQDYPRLQSQFRKSIEVIDRKRNESFTDHFPELKELYGV